MLKVAKIPEVSPDTWKKLYAAASQFEALMPWKTFDDDELFGVQDPADGQMGYGCILGALGEVLALNVYRGAEGFDLHQRMQKAEIDFERGEFLPLQNCLMAEFTDRESLEKADLEAIRKLGLHFRGPRAWPMFRSHLPNHGPWHLAEPEAVFLTFALRCACDVTRKVEAGELDLKARQGQVFCYFPKGSVHEFETRWEPHPTHRAEPPPPLALDAERLTKIRQKPLAPGGVWEADVSYFPVCLTDRDRPYFPRNTIVADRDSHFILGGGVLAPEKPAHQALADAVLESVESSGTLPNEVHVRDDKMVAALAPLGKELGVKIEARGRLDSVLDARRGLEGFLRKKHGREPKPPPRRLDRRALEKVTFNLSRKLKDRVFESTEEANRYLRELQEEGEMESSPAPENPWEVAQNLMYNAFEETNPNRRAQMARRALEISPDCADAYCLLAEETTTSPEEALDYYQKGVEAGERALGKDFFEQNAGHFWGIIETRPYMRARAELARCLWLRGNQQAALVQWQEMLRLNPGDNQGMRYVLAAKLGELGHFEELDELLSRKEYREDCGLEWLLMKILAAFVRRGPSSEAAQALEEALGRNIYFPGYLLKKKRLPRRPPDRYALGSEEEAVSCVFDVMAAWEKAPGALEWVASEMKKRELPRVGWNGPCPCGSGKKHKKCCGR